MSTRVEMGAKAGTGTRIERGVEGRESAKGGLTPTSNQQPQPQDLKPERDHRIMRRTIDRAEVRVAMDRIGEGGGGAKKRKKTQRS